MGALLAAADAAGVPLIGLLAAPQYNSRFGFRPAKEVGVMYFGRLDGALNGTLTTTDDRENTKAKLLSGGNPQIPKGEGDTPVQAYIAAMPGWKRSLGERLDDLVVRTVPGVNKAVKWNQPLYGHEDTGWFLGFRCYAKYVQLQFFRGSSLVPIPPKASTSGEIRYFDIYEDDDLDQDQLSIWIDQASKLPGKKL